MLQRHPISAVFAMHDLEGEGLKHLAESIQANGLRIPITLHEGMILDGWNRSRACDLVGIEPSTVELPEGSDPFLFAWDLNANRARNLTPNERTVSWIKLETLRGSMEAECPVLDTKGGRPKLDTPSVRDIAKSLDVSRGTAQKAQQIAKVNDPALVKALAEKRVSLDGAAALAKLPDPERKAALEAPPAPKPAPKPEVEDVSALKAENEELKDQLHEMATLMQGLQEELEAARRILDSEDLLAQFNKEVKRAQAMASTVQSRNNGLMNENSDLKGRLKSALRKIERLEKAAKKAQPTGEEIEGSREPDYDEVG